MRQLETEDTPLIFVTGEPTVCYDDECSLFSQRGQTTISNDFDLAAAAVMAAATRRRTRRTTAIVSVVLGVLTVLSLAPAWQRKSPKKSAATFHEEGRSDLELMSLSHIVGPCDQIMVGVWTKTCLVHLGMNLDHLESEGMVSYIYVTLSDGSFAEIQSDGNGFMSMYGTYNYVAGSSASRNQNCLAKYTSYYKQDPIDNWLPAPGSFTYNAWELGKDFVTNIPNSLSCNFDRIKGQDCRNVLARLLSHLAGDGVALSQYWNAARELC